jgi:CRP-like cAMP-binding protein
LTQSPSRQYIEAIEETTLYAIHYAALQEMYATSKNGERLGRLSAEGLFIEKEIHEASLMLDSPDERFNSLLKYKRDWIQRIPQKYLASYLNLTPETFSRLKKRNVLKK